MAKVIEEDDNDFEEDDEFDEFEEEQPVNRGRKKSILPEEPVQERTPKVKKKRAPAQRYTAFHQQEAHGIADVETQEVIATDVLEALANILARLERIETTMGDMLGTR